MLNMRVSQPARATPSRLAKTTYVLPTAAQQPPKKYYSCTHALVLEIPRTYSTMFNERWMEYIIVTLHLEYHPRLHNKVYYVILNGKEREFVEIV